VKTAHANADEKYAALGLHVNALEVLEPDSTYETFIDEMNELIGRFKKNVVTKPATDPKGDG